MIDDTISMLISSALEAEVGIEIETNFPEQLRQALYREMRTSGVKLATRITATGRVYLFKESAICPPNDTPDTISS